jgi:hypothetical protein
LTRLQPSVVSASLMEPTGDLSPAEPAAAASQAPLPGRLRPFLLSTAGVILLLVLAVFHSPKTVSDLQRVDLQPPKPVEVPNIFAHDAPTAHTSLLFQGVLETGWFTPNYISLRADDCIEEVSVDGKKFFTGRCSSCEHCKQFRVNLPRDLPHGAHTLTIKVGDNGGHGVFDLLEAQGFSGWGIFGLVLLAAAWLGVCTWRRTPVWAAWLGMVAVLLSFQYLRVTDSDIRQHDVHGHKEYIEHLLKKQTLPGVKQGWETWQPPAYYTLAAVFTAVTEPLFPAHDVHRRAQYFAALLYSLTCMLALLFWKRLGFSPRAAWVGPLMLVLIPAHVFQSGRVSNDTIMPLLGMAVTFVACAYVKEARRSLAFVLGLLILWSLMTKTSSLSLAAGAGLVVLWKDQVDGRRFVERLVRAAATGVPGLAWLAFWFWRNKQQTGDWMYVNASLTDALRVPNVAYKYVWFDLPSFLAEPQFGTYSGHLRESFPTALATSALSGEFNLDHVGPTWLTFLRLAFLPMIFIFVYGAFTRPQVQEFRPWVPALFLFGMHAFFMVSYNWRYSYACNEDARLWSPAYFPAAVLFAHGYEVVLQRWHRRGRWLLLWAPVLFAIMACVVWSRLLYPA